MKALGTGWGKGVGWRDFEVLPAGDGPPRIVLHGEAAKLAARRGLVRWLVALSHTDAGALASVVVESDGPVRAGYAAAGGRRRAAAAKSGRRRPTGPR
jgi:holo-[acyl-carrier protein] synthase